MFVVFEGPDGAGKSTQARLLSERLEEHGLDVTSVREPGGTDVGEALRAIMFREPPPSMQPVTWALLMNAARAELVVNVIRPALDRGSIVIADRYWYSTLAYQSGGEGVDPDLTRHLSLAATAGLEPDLIIFIDVPPESGLARKGNRLNVLDRRPIEFHQRVRLAYHAMADQHPDRWLTFDGLEPRDELAGSILSQVLSKIGNRATMAAL